MEELASLFGFKLVFDKPFQRTLFLFFLVRILTEMFYSGVLVACLLPFCQAQADLLAGSTRRYKPVIQVTEEIDINDITFTTSAPEFDRSASHKTPSRYDGIKPDKFAKGGHGRLGDTSPSVFPHLNHKDSYDAVDKIYSTGQPFVVPTAKYKPYKVFRVQDGFGPVSYKPKVHERSKLLPFDPPNTYNAPEKPKQYLTKVLPYSDHLVAKPPTKASNFLPQENKNFIPSPTFLPTVLAQTDSNRKFAEAADVQPFTTQKAIDWPKPTKKPHHVKKGKNRAAAIGPEDFTATSEDSNPSSLHKESPQQSESFLSEISTLHKGGNNFNGVGDALDLKTGERVEFQMYGMDGPQSYKFGFDTGKGHNRHFRFEERDNTGRVKGHYGYLDEDGKMRIMKYEADPVTGFHAGPVEISSDDN